MTPKPAEIKPAAPATAPAAPATPAPAVAKADNGSDEVAKAVAAWASAWSRKDMKAYLGAYASDFETPKGMSRKAWEDEREQRIAGKAGKISVTVDEPQARLPEDAAPPR